tara:strand:+ start:258 stop:878 length:621 start_codon:yes stop_codon:yes gene_type:complete
MNKVKTMEEAYRVFELLGIKEVTKKWQKAKGTEVWELPFKTMYNNGSTEINRFTIYKNGYVRKMVVYGENDATQSCYQLNRVRKVHGYAKDYEWCDDKNGLEWTGKYNKIYHNERIMIDNHRDRVVYLCNYILKNYYNNKKYSLVGEYTRSRIETMHGEWWRNERKHDEWPFEKVETNLISEDTKHGISPNHNVQVIINGHRYNLS